MGSGQDVQAQVAAPFCCVDDLAVEQPVELCSFDAVGALLLAALPALFTALVALGGVHRGAGAVLEPVEASVRLRRITVGAPTLWKA